VLWEIGHGITEVRSLRARLDLDSGYLSRLLTALEADGLISVEKGGSDGRVREARLTTRGREECAELDRLSDEQAASILAPLGDTQRRKLVDAMADVERLLGASMVEVTVSDPASAAARECFAQYYRELAARFDAGFDPGKSISAADDELRLPAGALLMARLHSEVVACGALKLHADGIAEIKRMWVSPGARGLGLGRRMLDELEALAAGRGIRTIRLETNRSLTEAIRMYRAAGYREVPAFNDERYAHHWFEKTLEKP
jgi:DNA-binding MarR family transcriptional regulator/predicted GNAT family N-acyltransferase